MANTSSPFSGTPMGTQFGVPMVQAPDSGADILAGASTAEAEFLLALASGEASAIVTLMINMNFVGVLIPSGNAVLAPYSLWPNGQNVSRTTYSALFDKWGTTFGAGDGSTTFGTMDIRGRAIACIDNAGGVSANRLTGIYLGGMDGDVIGAAGGEEGHVPTLVEMMSHTHVVDGDLVVSPGAGISIRWLQSSGAGAANVSSRASGSSGAHNTVQPTIALPYMIFAGA